MTERERKNRISAKTALQEFQEVKALLKEVAGEYGDNQSVQCLETENVTADPVSL